MSMLDRAWWELDKITDEISDYWTSHPTEVWKDGNYLRSSFLLYYCERWKDEIFKKLHKVIKSHDWEIVRISKPKKAKVSGHVVRIYLKKISTEKIMG